MLYLQRLQAVPTRAAYRLGMLGLTLLAFGWRVQGLAQQSLWRDEVDAIWFATRPLPDTLAMFVQTAQNGPLYFLSLRPWFWLVGSSEFALRFPSAAAGALCVPLLWQLARHLIPPPQSPVADAPPNGTRSDEHSETHRPRWAPALAAAFFAVHPYHLWYAQEGKMYAIITLFALLATWFWWQGIQRGDTRFWFAYWLTVTLAIYTHLLFILILPLHFVWFWIAWPTSRPRWRGYVGALAGLTLPYVPLIAWQWQFLWSDAQMTHFRFTPFSQIAQTLVTHHAQGFAPHITLIWLGPVFFLAGAGIILGGGEIGARHAGAQLASGRRYLLLLSWILVPVVTIYLLSLRQPVFTDRYVVWIGPALLLFMALGATAVRTHALWLARTVTALLVVYVVGFWLYGGWLQKTLPMKYDLRAGVTYVAQRRAPGELLMLQIPHLAWAYGYYTSDQSPRPFTASDARLGHWIGGLWTNHDWPDDVAWNDVQAQMAQYTANDATFWLLRSEPEMWDSRNLLDRWLEANAELLDRADFAGVEARHYRLD
ncbi:MAG: hypothetical protein WDZ49_01085 [Litorilinea sp.]